MQNKANFRKSQVCVSPVITADYENETLGKCGKNKPNTKPNKANSKPIQTQTKPITEKAKMNVSSIITKDYENKPHFWAKSKQSQFKPKQTQSLVKDLNALVNAWMFIGKTAKNSCARLWALLQCFSENCDKPGERKAECSARPKLRTDPMNLLGTMPAKEGKIDLKHSFCGPR